MKKVLQINHFYIFPENSGGHKRVAAVNKAIKESGCESLFLSIGPSYPNLRRGDYVHINLDVVLRESKFGWYSVENTMMEYADEFLFEKVSKLVESFAPDVVIFEHPWWFPFFKKVFYELGISPKIIYSSLNIESELKRSILEKMKIPAEYVEETCAKIRLVEEDLCKHSELVVCVTEHDAKWFSSLGARELMVVENRITLVNPHPSDIEEFRGIAESNRYVIFVGSAHPPNVMGMKDVLGANWGFIPPDCRILLMGGVASAFFYDPFFKEYWKTNYSRVILRPDCSDSAIAAALRHAVAVILPVKDGGGSNLKTIEALLSGRNIISTSKSFDGHELYANDSAVTIVNEPDKFREVITDAFRKDAQGVKRDASFSHELSWEKQLAPLSEYLRIRI